MAEYVWPARADAQVIGKPYTKVDAIAKSTGTAKYAYDINPPKMLLARALGCPHAHCKVKSVDPSAAEKVPGVAKVMIKKQAGDEIQFQGDLLAYVVGETEGAIAEGLQALKFEYEMLDVFVVDDDVEAAKTAGRTARGGNAAKLDADKPEGMSDEEYQTKELDRLFKECAAVVEGRYGVPVVAHMCLEPHGATCEFNDGKLTAHVSIQNVAGAPTQFTQQLRLSADDVTAHCDYVGGGFGSKFQVDYWMVDAARMARELGRPVKLMLDRDTEVKIAGCRPSGFADVKIGADKDGLVKVWDSHHTTTNGIQASGGLGVEVMPYVMAPKQYRRRSTVVRTNASPSRAWRAPNHPQGSALSQTALDDIAAKLGLDSYDVFLKNLANCSSPPRVPVYTEEMKIGAKLIDWKAKWHPHGKGPVQGSIVSGLGMALHTWRGGGQRTSMQVKIHPDGAVESFVATQDLGTGTRTVIAMVLAETFGLPVDAVKVNLGDSKYPRGPSSGGSVTVASVSESARHAGIDAWTELAKKVGEKLSVNPDSLIAKGGRIQDKSDASKGMSWKDACSLLGMTPLDITANGAPGGNSKLSSDNVGGVQMAEVQVDRETGVIKMKKFVAVQDCGLIINPKTAKSQINGAMIMGICNALFEERIMDAKTGAYLNADCADYKLARLGDIGEFVVELYEPDSERNRGVIGLGEPPTVSPMAAISNAVCNALGVRVPVLPMTPKRVLDALKGRTA